MLNTSSIRIDPKVLAGLTRKLRVSARRAGWPEDVAKQLRVTLKDMDVTVSYPYSAFEAVTNLEYGTPSSPPKSVIRTFQPEATKVIQEAIEASVIGLFV